MVGDPAQFYAELRAHGPVVKVNLDGDVPAYLVIGWNECNHVLRTGYLHSRDLRRWSVPQQGGLPPDWPLAPHVQWMPNMLHAEGEEHARLRDAFTASLGKIRSGRLKAVVERAATQLIDGFLDAGRADLVSQYAVPLPMLVLARLFGFPPEDEPRLQRAIMTLLEGGEGALAANEELVEIIEGHVERRRAEPRADIVSGLLEAGLGLSEVRWTVWLSINAGMGATTAWLANVLELLARTVDTQLDLRSGFADVPGVMGQVLWDHTPVQQVIGRVTTTALELGGLAIPQGALLIVSLAGANLDHTRFGTADARSSCTYGNKSHLAWGNGPHECPAPDLATAIVRDGVELLRDRLDDIHLTHPGRPTRWSPSIIVRIPGEGGLDVSWDPGRARGRAETFAPAGGR
ncbi:cytochrome P450 [Streptomyces sp. NBC_00996]|uniref:cytochrome P450 n=1 Tax=Streptomyces sp. NBC_00996 TaxID=2903710 RepID=UPI0038703923|nr:cytochrome P450 [Streptomyces sp. NBC_00996]